MNKVFIALLKLFFGATSSVAPKAIAPLAFRLFCTTFKPSKKSKKYQAMLSDSQALFDKAESHTIQYSGGTVSAHEFIPHQEVTEAQLQSPTVLIVHGWQSHARHMHRFVQPLMDKGSRVVVIDLPGHGQSSGRLFHLPLAVSAVHAVKESLGQVDMILSHSLGGAVVASALAGTVLPHPSFSVDKLVLISSPNSMRKIFDDFASMIGLSKAARLEMDKIVKKLSGSHTEDFLVADQLLSSSADLLLMHAPDDKEVAFIESEGIAKANPSTRLKPMPGLGHRRIISSDDVVNEAVEFLLGS